MSVPLADSAGALHLRLSTRRDRVTEAALLSTRRTDVARRLFVGRPVGYMLDTLPLIFSVCATAQATAAVRACERAVGTAPAGAVERGRDLLVLKEIAREHLMRILLGWSAWLRVPPPAVALAAIGSMRGAWHQALFPQADGFRLGGGRLRPDRQTLEQLLDDLNQVVELALGTPAEEWQAIQTPDQLHQWSRRGEACAQRMLRLVAEDGWSRHGDAPFQPLPELPARTLEQLLGDPAAEQFAAAPEWDDAPRETGALARQADQPLIAALRRECGHGLLTRLAARLTELAMLPGRIAALFDCLRPASAQPQAGELNGSGLAQVEAARGRLVHWVHLERGLLREHRILAPTEWNFHPRGVVQSALRGLAVGPELSRLAQLLVDAVDPCVECRIEVTEHA